MRIRSATTSPRLAEGDPLRRVRGDARQDHVVDPFSPECAVVTGSQNLGHKASFNNDENLIIVRGQRPLAEAYATHVLDIYDHFSWRWIIQSQGQARAETMLSVDADEWQSRYFDTKGNIRSRSCASG